MSTSPAPSLGQLINRAARGLARDGDAALKPLGFRYAQIPVLALLRIRGALTQKSLTDATGMEQPSMAQLLTRMDRDGLIERVPHPHDARSRTIELAGGIGDRLDRARRRLDDLDERAVAGFSSEEIHTLIELLTRLNNNLEPVASTDPASP